MADSAKDRARRYRQRRREQGLRQVQIWVIDTRAPGFAEEARRQCEAINRSSHAEEDQAFVDAISIEWGPFEA